MVLRNTRALAQELELPETHYIFHRLDGANPFAHFDVHPCEQVTVREKRIGMRVRYAAFNYCFSMHGTLEYRLLPMFKDAATAINFIQVYLSTVETFLEANKNHNLSKRCSLADVGGRILQKGLS
jgi:hypothetical protein